MQAYGLTCLLGMQRSLALSQHHSFNRCVCLYNAYFLSNLFSLILKAVGIFSVWIILISQLFAYVGG